jgi:hypothetical protein
MSLLLLFGSSGTPATYTATASLTTGKATLSGSATVTSDNGRIRNTRQANVHRQRSAKCPASNTNQ